MFDLNIVSSCLADQVKSCYHETRCQYTFACRLLSPWITGQLKALSETDRPKGYNNLQGKVNDLF